MNISDRYRYLYFVTPKSGSATVRHAIAPSTDIGYPVSHFLEHCPIKKFRAKYDDEGRFETHFKFTFVRNPYDRAYSAFRQDVWASEHAQGRPWIDAKKPIFDEIGEDFGAYLERYVAEADIRTAWDYICFCPSVEFSYSDGRYVLDWCGRMETLHDDINELKERLGLETNDIGRYNHRAGPLPTAETTPKYLAHYNRTSVEIINRLYADDFAAFDYEALDPAEFPNELEPSSDH